MRTVRTYLTDLRLKLRPYWLVLVRDLKRRVTTCQICKKYGASPCSICAGINLCDHCQRTESIKLDVRLKVDKYLAEWRKDAIAHK